MEEYRYYRLKRYLNIIFNLMKSEYFIFCTFLVFQYAFCDDGPLSSDKSEKSEKSEEMMTSKNDTLLLAPFSSIKMIGDKIEVSFDANRKTWYILGSVNTYGADAIVNFSKSHFGSNMCDNSIECFKYHIIHDFEDVYEKFTEDDLPEKIPLELFLNGKQIGMDIEQTNEKYLLSKKYESENMKASKTVKPTFLKK